MSRTLFGLSLTAVMAMGAPNTTPPTFNKDVLPILQKNCQTCHRPGEIAPMSLVTYKETRPWAKAMKDAVLQKKMPPWFAKDQPAHPFTNARGLSESEISTLVAWTDAGAPEGNAKDRPAPPQWPAGGWAVKPDMVVEMMNDYQIPATGTIDYLWEIAKADFKEDTWVRAAELRPGSREHSHHMRVYLLPPGSKWLDGVPPGVAVTQKEIAEYAQKAMKARGETGRPAATPETFIKWNPGLDVTNFDIDGAAKLIPKGSDIVFQMHYSTNGKAATDRSKVAFELARYQPKLRYMISDGLSNTKFILPPGESNFEVRQESTAQEDIKLVWLQPHMHLRGKDFKLTAYYPSGESEVLLDAKFDFNWQIGYEFKKPVTIPKGTKLVGIAHFDNSVNNQFNPDPKASVKFGPQSWDEMSVTFMAILVDLNSNPERILRNAESNGPRQGVVPLD